MFLKNGSFVVMSGCHLFTHKNALISLFFLLWLGSCRQQTWAPSLSMASKLEVHSEALQDSQMLVLIYPYRQGLEKAMNDTIGFLSIDLMKGDGENLLGNFVSDLLLIKASEVYDTLVDMAAVTNGGLRTPLKKGYLKVGDIYELMPFDNELLLLRIHGRQVEQLFTYMYQRKNLSVSNSKVVFDHYGHIHSLHIGGEPYDPTRFYSLAISDYLATGGDQMGFLTASESAVSAHYKVRDAIIDYVREQHKAGDTIQAEIDGRATIIEEDSHE
jgi:2',3'-cyclic-nucleotide 2'-phosphodiesterase (5'-nucleotidase family)